MTAHTIRQGSLYDLLRRASFAVFQKSAERLSVKSSLFPFACLFFLRIRLLTPYESLQYSSIIEITLLKNSFMDEAQNDLRAVSV